MRIKKVVETAGAKAKTGWVWALGLPKTESPLSQASRRAFSLIRPEALPYSRPEPKNPELRGES